MKNSRNGFTIVEIVLVIFVIGLLVMVGTYVFGRTSSQKAMTEDAMVSEQLTKAHDELSRYVTEHKAIPTQLTTEGTLTYRWADNQTAELCATFAVPRSGRADSWMSPGDIYTKYFGSTSHTIKVYRDAVDFYDHKLGRNCYLIGYAPINVAYEDRYKGDDKNWQYCDAHRQYHGRFTGQTIRGFVIGGSFTTSPGTSGGRAVLASDVDAYDEACVKIPVSALKVGDRVEFGFEQGPTSNGETVYFVKAIKKTP